MKKKNKQTLQQIGKNEIKPILDINQVDDLSKPGLLSSLCSTNCLWMIDEHLFSKKVCERIDLELGNN